MLRNNLIIAWRNLMRHRLHTAINLAGLGLGPPKDGSSQERTSVDGAVQRARRGGYRSVRRGGCSRAGRRLGQRRVPRH